MVVARQLETVWPVLLTISRLFLRETVDLPDFRLTAALSITMCKYELFTHKLSFFH